jgi:hypothetical protein
MMHLGMLALGAVAFAVLFLFIRACDRLAGADR